MRPIRALVWGENHHDQHDPSVQVLYPETMHATIAHGLTKSLGDGVRVSTATLDDEQHGLTAERLNSTDVLVWWGHVQHDAVSDEVVDRVHRHVLGGMGLIVLHSGHFSKIFTRLMGTTCSLRWRAAKDRELIWTVAPAHPIADGIPQPLVLAEHEMYGEHFDVPEPDDLIFVSGFSGGEVFRSGMTFTRGHGRVFYFSPGDQEYPIFHNEHVQRVIANGLRWAYQDRDRRAPQIRHEREGKFDVHPARPEGGN